MAEIFDFMAYRRLWRTLYIPCNECEITWEGVVPTEEIVEFECPYCGNIYREKS